MSATTQKLARQIRDHSRTQAERQKHVLRANVTKTSPLTVEILGEEKVLLEADDDFDLTAWMRFYDAQYTIERGETVLLHREAGHYVMFDVLTEKAIVP